MTKCLLWPLPLSDSRCSFLILDSQFRLDPRVCTICTSAYELRWGPKLGNRNECFPRIWYKGNEAHEKSHKTVDGQSIFYYKIRRLLYQRSLWLFPLLFSSRRIDYWKSVDDTLYFWMIDWNVLIEFCCDQPFFFVSLNPIKSLLGSCMSERRCNETEKCSKTGSPFSLFLFTVVCPGEYIFTIQQVASSLRTRKQTWHQFTIITSTAYNS